jgi:hypothetical protein
MDFPRGETLVDVPTQSGIVVRFMLRHSGYVVFFSRRLNLEMETGLMLLGRAEVVERRVNRARKAVVRRLMNMVEM